MKRLLLFFLMILSFFLESSAQKMNGYGPEFSVLGLNLDARFWINKKTGLEVFGGMASSLESFNPNDVVAGIKYLHVVQYRRTDRTYFGIVGKWKWVDVFEPYKTTNLPVPGIFMGKEWFSKRIHRKGFAIEFGYQYGVKTYQVTNPDGTYPKNTTFTEFPMILNLRYSFYQIR